MPEYIFRRLLLAVPTFIGAVTLVFLVMRVLPGDAASVILAGQETAIEASDEQLAALREQLGLNRPLIVQYFQWLWDAVRFDFGDSLWILFNIFEKISRACLSMNAITITVLLLFFNA